MNFRWIIIGYVITVAIGVATFAYVVTLDLTSGYRVARENGPIEMVSALGYFICALYALFAGGFRYLKKYSYFIFLVIGFGTRELDFYWQYASNELASGKGKGFVSLKYYLNPDVPGFEKAIGITLFLAVIYIAVSLIKNHFMPFLPDLLRRCPVSIGAALVIALLGFSQFIDKAIKIIEDSGIFIDMQTRLYAQAGEESAEMVIPMVILIAFVAYFTRQQRS